MRIRNTQRNFSGNSEKGDAAIKGGLAIGAAGGLGSLAYKVSSAKKAKKAIKEAERIASEELNGKKLEDLRKAKQEITAALEREEAKKGLSKIFNSAKSKRKDLKAINSTIEKLTNQINSVKSAAVEKSLAKAAKSSKKAKIAAAIAATAAAGGIGTGLIQKNCSEPEEKEFGLKEAIKRVARKWGRNHLLTPKEKNLAKELNKKETEINRAAKKTKKLEQEAKTRRDNNTKLNKLVQDLNKENAALREEKRAAEESAKLWKVATAGTAAGGLGLGAAGYAIGNKD